jgi:hypothetical protein
VIFFGSGRMMWLPFLIFFLLPVVFYTPAVGLILAAIAIVAVVSTSRSRRQRRLSDERFPEVRGAAPFQDVKRTATEDILSLADDIRSLDLDIEMPNVTAEAKSDYARALDRYDDAKAAFGRARVPQDFAAVSSAVEEGRFDIASTRARLAGKEPPQRRAPCFFDPRHGPSVRDVSWAPHGGTTRPVPACAADAIAIEEGHQPRGRQVHVGDQQVAYWNAPAYYGPWAGGFFGPFGGALPGLLLGSALGSGLFAMDEWDAYGSTGNADGEM